MVALFASVFMGIIFGVSLLLLMGIYNGLQSIKKQVKRNWESVELFLKRREEELPRLVELLVKIAPQEKAVLAKVSELRERFSNANSLADKILISNEMTNILASLFLIAEAYPELQRSGEFKMLQSRILEIEKQICARQEHFNTTIKVYNHRSSQFPDMFFAQTMGFHTLEFLKTYEDGVEESNYDFRAAA
ncbi:MAG: LemA family protein [Bdellovibrionota bacterium]